MTLIRLFTGSSELAPHIVVGKNGENVAATFLRRLGYRILDRNVRVGKKDEIDIVAFDPLDRVYVFAEVKSRSRADEDFRPELNITPHKRNRMTHAARRWMVKRDEDVGYRMDVVCVVEGAVTAHYKEVEWSR